ncbi:hypothetical protein [Burkholderia gladioli]|uniref:Uncharacterized protein n=1 Tax=Burkholderia gladioli TaxID=28095 RepID=A0AB38U665_BURGA|nr:hypothetical protein [Burkholderia gladioli]UWX75467.1 hypothetical protein NYZ96_35445 [Burkholderia gladioli]
MLAAGAGRAAAATSAAAALALRNARIAPWLGVPRGAAVVPARGRGPARRLHGKTSGGIRALAVNWSAPATVAAAALELRNARIAPWLGVLRGAAVATVRGRRPARRRLGENRWRRSCAGSDQVGGGYRGERTARGVAHAARANSATLRGKGEGQDGVTDAMTADAGKTARAPKSLDEEIERAAARLKRLQEQKRTKERQEVERNERAIAELLKAEKLNVVPAEKWKAGLAGIRRALGVAASVPDNSPAAPAGGPASEA